MSSSMSTTSERELLMQCLEGEDLPGPDSLGLVEDLVPEEHPPSRSAAAQLGSHGSRPNSTARSPVGAPSPPAAAEASLSRAFSSPADAAQTSPAGLGGSASTVSSKQLRTSSTGAPSSHTAAWLQQMDAVGTLLQASEGNVPVLSGPTYRPTLNTSVLPRAAAPQQQSLMESARSGPLLEGQQASQQNMFQQQQQSVGTPTSSTASAAARARAANQQRSASLDLLSPSAAQSLFPTLTASQPDATARLTPEQYQLFVNTGIDPALAAAAMPVTTPTATDSQLDAAEALWQQIAASGADDQTLISLAVSLGLITTDASGNMMLAREARLRSAASMSAAQLRNPLLASQGLQGLYGNILDAAAAAAAASPRVPSASDSAPLPRLPHSALAGLLGVYSGMRLSTASTPGNTPKPLGSPGPGPSKQHTLYKTELCRGWLEAGTCRYGSKCQFAHGPEELRPVPRHPKYKTEVCRSFTATGVCAYGPRCRFIHGTMSAPTNVLEQPGSARLPEGFEGLEGVLGFEDVSPTQGTALDSRRSNMVSPNRTLLNSLAGPSMALRQAQGAGLTHSMLAAAAAASSSALTAQDAAAMTRLGRLLSSPAAAAAGGGRTSLDSAISMAMARTALLGGGSTPSGQSQSDMRRSSMSDVQRSSLDSRGRTSIESSQSQLEWAAQQASCLPDTPVGVPGAFTSPLKQGGADLLAAHQPYMPGIPEGYAMPHIPHETPQWPGRAGVPSGGFNTPSASDVGQLGQLAGFSFQPSPTAPVEQAAAAGNAPGQWFASGKWWSLASNKGDPTSLTEGPSSGGLQSAYSSGLYASSSANAAKQPQVSNSGMSRQSNPGLLTPEKSEGSTMGPGSEGAEQSKRSTATGLPSGFQAL